MSGVAAAALPRIVTGARARWFAALVANGLAQALLAFAAAWLTRRLFDEVLPAGAAAHGDGLVVFGGLLLVVPVLAWLRWRETVDAEQLAQHYVAQVRLALFDRLAVMAPQAAQRRSRGGLMLRFVGDVQALRAWVGRGIARLLVACGTGAMLLAVLAWLDLLLMAAVAALLCGTGALMVRFGADLRARIAEGRRRNAHIAANMHDKIDAVPVMQVFNQAPRERERLRRQNRSLRRAMTARAHARGRNRALTELCVGLTGLLVLAQALWPLTGAVPSVGTLVGAMGLVGLLAAPLRDLGRVFEHWHAACVAQLRIGEFLAAPTLSPQRDAAATVPRTCTLDFDAVSVAGSLRGASAELPPGRRVALVGAVGSGKSALLAVAAGLLDADQGEVRLHGHALRSLRADVLHARISMVAPDLGLLRGTIESNLRYRCPDATADQVERACAAGGLDRVLPTLPDGLRTPVRDAGRNLSAGQRRAVVLTRALVGDPAILLIDDAESCFDGEPLRCMAELLRRFDGSVLYVARTPALAALADEAWRIEAGRLSRSVASAAPALHVVGAAGAPA